MPDGSSTSGAPNPQDRNETSLCQRCRAEHLKSIKVVVGAPYYTRVWQVCDPCHVLLIQAAERWIYGGTIGGQRRDGLEL